MHRLEVKPVRTLLYLLLMLMLVTFSACDSGYLAKTPPGQVPEQTFWRSSSNAVKFVNALYRELPGDVMILWDAMSDNAHQSWSFPCWLDIGKGVYDASNSCPENVWKNRYEGIRQANVLLANIDKVEDIDPALKKRLIGEARFMRAYFYHDLVRFFGSVPLITRPQGLDSTDVPRAPKKEVVALILEDLTKAAERLPLEYDASNGGRATKGAALTLKSRVLLYNERWAEAATAAKAVMDLGVYELFPDYYELFQPENEDNVEVILAHQYMKDVYPSHLDTWCQPPGFAGWGRMDPLRSLVEAYEMIDGKPIEESPLYDPAHPFENRDPRLDATILHTGSEWKGEVLDTRSGVPPNGVGADVDASSTGYYLHKYMDEQTNAADRHNSETDFILLRYAEVLLNYAEAKNEAAGPVPSVYEAINQVRARVDMPPLPAGLSQAQMRQRIHHERRIELAFEGHRYFDIQRWDIADEVMNGSVYGIQKENGEYVFVEERVWKPHYDLWPIPQREMDINSELTQNPGW